MEQNEPVLDGDRIATEVPSGEDDAGIPDTQPSESRIDNTSPLRVRASSDPEKKSKKQPDVVLCLKKSQSTTALPEVAPGKSIRDPLTGLDVTSAGTDSTAAAEPPHSSFQDTSSTSSSYLSVRSQPEVDDQGKEGSQSDLEPFWDFPEVSLHVPGTIIVPAETMQEETAFRSLPESTIYEETLRAEFLSELDQPEGEVTASSEATDVQEDISSLQEMPQAATSVTSKNYAWQSVFTQERYQTQAYENIRSFLTDNPSLARGGNYQEACFDLDFSKKDDIERTKLKARPEGYIRKIQSEKVNAETSVMPLVAVELYRNDLKWKTGWTGWIEGDTVRITSCENSYSYQWLSKKNPPFIFVVHILLPEISLILNYAKPGLYPFEGGYQQLMNNLFYSVGNDFDKAVKKLKLIPQVINKMPSIHIPLVGDINDFMDTAAIVKERFSYLPFCDEERVGEDRRHFEVCIDMRASLAVRSLFGTIKSQAKSMHLNLAFTVEPLDKKEQEKEGGESQLPEVLFAGVEIKKPVFGTVDELEELGTSGVVVHTVK
ncbi:hypothetical protein GCM10023116_28350 [Kistimonas scapharcae]|uniref:Protein ENHANCED DISEASE RESISTANCE 2 C-terminal domain-containing protein n=1 Tax=Kistimonas scapharcae TaxID=1036133 RepID=A0ABP8V6I5_9GAMM